MALTSNQEVESTMMSTVMSGRQAMLLSCSWAENGPNLTTARETLEYWLDIHIYLFAVCFAIILLYAVYATISIMRRTRVRRRLWVSLHAMIAMSASARSLSLFVDPYGFRGFIPCPLNVIIWSFGWPGIISSYSIFFLTVLETTRVSIASPRLRRFSVLVLLIIIHLGYVLFADLLVSFYPNSIISIAVCEIIFIFWGVLIAIGFIFVWWKMRKNLSASCPRNARERRRSSSNGTRVAAAESEVRQLNRLVTVLIFSAFICFALTISHVKPIIDILHPSVVNFMNRPWQWFVYQTGQRILEITMCLLIILAMPKPKETHDKEQIIERIEIENKANDPPSQQRPTIYRKYSAHKNDLAFPDVEKGAI